MSELSSSGLCFFFLMSTEVTVSLLQYEFVKRAKEVCRVNRASKAIDFLVHFHINLQQMRKKKGKRVTIIALSRRVIL